MKTFKIFLKPISLLLAFLVFFQGCTVYQYSGATLDDAIQSKNRVRVEKKNGEIEKFNQIIVLDDGKIYGKRKIRSKTSQFYELVEIIEQDINKIQLKDKTVSTLLTIGMPLFVIGGMLGIVVLHEL